MSIISHLIRTLPTAEYATGASDRKSTRTLPNQPRHSEFVIDRDRLVPVLLPPILLVLVLVTNCQSIGGQVQYLQSKSRQQYSLTDEREHALYVLDDLGRSLSTGSSISPSSRAELMAGIADTIWNYDYQGAHRLLQRAVDLVFTPAGAADEYRSAAADSSVVRSASVVSKVVLARDPHLFDAMFSSNAGNGSDESLLTPSFGRSNGAALAEAARCAANSDPKLAYALGARSLEFGKLPDFFGRTLTSLRNRDMTLASDLFQLAAQAVARSDFTDPTGVRTLLDFVVVHGGSGTSRVLASKRDLGVALDVFNGATGALERRLAAANAAGHQSLSESDQDILGALRESVGPLSLVGERVDMDSLDRRLLLLASEVGVASRQSEKAPELGDAFEFGDPAAIRVALERIQDPQQREYFLATASLSQISGNPDLAFEYSWMLPEGEERTCLQDAIRLSMACDLAQEHDFQGANRQIGKMVDKELRGRAKALMSAFPRIKEESGLSVRELLAEAYRDVLRSPNSERKVDTLLLIATRCYSSGLRAMAFDVLRSAAKTMGNLTPSNKAEQASRNQFDVEFSLGGVPIGTCRLGSDQIDFESYLTPLVRADYSQVLEIGSSIADRELRARFQLSVSRIVLAGSSPADGARR